MTTLEELTKATGHNTAAEVRTVVHILMLRAGTPTEAARHTYSLVYRTTRNRPRMFAAIACSTPMAAMMRLHCRTRKGHRLRLARTLL